MKFFSKAISILGIATVLIGIPSTIRAQQPETAKTQRLSEDFYRREVLELHTQYISRKSESEQWFYLSRGNSRLGVGDHIGAMKDYTEVLQLNPDNAAAYYNRGYARSQLGDKKRAMKDFQKAADLFQSQGEQDSYQDVLKRIKKLQQSPSSK